MPLGRRKVTDRAKAAELQLGDLVLAKVKGFPAWPARPGHTSHGGKPGTLVRPNQKSTENDMPKGKLATSEGNPLHKASVDCRGDHFQFGAIKRKMAGNGDSPLAKKGSIFNDGRGNISKSYSKGESSHFMAEKKNSRNPIIMRSGSVRADNNITSTAEPHDNMRLSRLMKPCKGSGGVSKSSSTGTADLTKKSISGTNGINFKHKLPFNRVPPSRRALRFVEDDDDGEDRKTPIHSVTTGILLRDYSGTFDSERKYHMRPESYRDSQNASLSNTGIVFIGNVSSRIEERTNNFTDIMETMDSSASRPFNFEEQVLKSSANLLAGPNSMKQEKCKTAGSNSRAANNELETLVYPGNADNLVCFKALKRQVKGANFYNAQFGDSCKAFGTTNLSRSSSIAEKSKQFLEKSKVMPKSSIPITVITENRSNVNISAGCYTEKDVSAGQRSDIMREATSTDSTDSKVTDSTVSMRHLIAAAQAKRRQAHSHQLLDGSGTPGSSLTPQCIHGRSPNLISTMQIFPSGDPFQDKKLFQTYVPSEPPLVSGQFLPVKQGEHEDYDRRPSTGNWLPTDSSSGSSEAEVARDALEGMIETLSRTRDSIGRATRHAIDCAKHGIANEVVELLIRKLEGEPSLSRRIDLFFLVDSITQCSHTQKGIAGASYVPVVQAALPRLLGAAAPTGASAHENRRQCLKVLRLWLERRILPEYFLRHYMDEIEVRNDGLNSRFSIGIPSFAERSVDDPIREMKNLLVDEYGSNTTFLFPGILSAHVLDGDEDFQSSPCNGTVDCSPIEACGVSEVLLGSEDRPMEAHHHILEHIENEIEMEDAITISPDERSTGGNFSCSIAPTHQEYYWVVKSTCGIQDKLLFLPAGYPPLPLDPPPTPPPLPSSPPPPAPSPPYSPQPLPLPQSLLTTPPPSPLSLPSELSAIISLTQSPFPSSPCRYTCCPPLLQEYCWMANDKQLRQPIGNNSIEYAITVGVKNEVVMQQSPNFMAHGISNSKKLSQQRGESIQLMHSHPALRAEKFLNHPLPSSQISSQHLSHAKSICQQHIQQKYNPNSSAFLHGQMNYGAEEQWISHPSDTDQHYSSAWNMGGKTPSCSSASFVQDGYCRLTMERADSTSTDFHPPHYSAPSQASLPGHSFPNSSGTDIWRPS